MGVDRYISHTGDDANTGEGSSDALAYRTIQKAVDNLGAGGTLYIKDDADYEFGWEEYHVSDLSVSGTTATSSGGHTFVAGDIGKVIWSASMTFPVVIKAVNGLSCTVSPSHPPTGTISWHLCDQGPREIDLDNANGDPLNNYWLTLTGLSGARPTMKTLANYDTTPESGESCLFLFDWKDSLVLQGLEIDASLTPALIGAIRVPSGSWFTKYTSKIVDCIIQGADQAISCDNEDMFLWISDCDISGMGTYGIKTLGPAVIFNNAIHENRASADYCTAIGVQSNSGANYVSGCVSHNLIYDLACDTYKCNGVDVDGGDWEISHNTVHGLAGTTGANGIRLKGATSGYDGSTTSVFNNLIVGASAAQISFGIQMQSGKASVAYEDYNCFYNCEALYENLTGGSHDLTVNPAFRDIANGDFMPLHPLLHRGGRNGQHIGAIRPQEYRRRAPRRILTGLGMR